MATRSRVVGVPKLRQKLRRIEPEMRSPLTRALEEGAAEIRDEAKRRVPVDTGALRDNIAVHPGRSKDGLSFRVGVKSRGGKRGIRKRLWPFYARWVEFGVAAQTKGARILRKDKRRKGGMTSRVSGRTTKGIPPRPFLYPAFQAKKRAVFARVQQAVDLVLRRVASGG